MKNKLIRTATVSLSLDVLMKGQLHYLNTYYKVLAISGGKELLLKVKEREQIDVIPIAIERSISPIKDLVSLYKLYRCFKKEKPQIVHSITPKAGLLSMVAAYLAKVPIRMHTFTGLIFPSKRGFIQRLLIIMDRILCLFATNIYPEGDGVRKQLMQYNITKKPLKVLANGNINGIDTSYFNPQLFEKHQKELLRAKLGIDENDVVFIFVGRLVGDKGINEMVAAFLKLQITNYKLQNFKLLLVGPQEPELDPLLDETIEEITNNSQIISVGWQEDVRPYFAIANVLVFPSYREGFPNVVMQAGAMGLPSIVTNINGCNEIIIEGENGWMIPVKDEAALLKAMQNCLIHTSALNKLSNNSRDLIVSRYEQKVVWEAILEEYKALEK